MNALEAELAAERAARRAAEAQVQALAAQQRILLTATSHMIWFKDAAGRYVFCNDAFLRFMNLDHDQVIGRTAAEIFPPAYAVDVEANDQKAVQTGAAIAIAGYVHKGRRLCWIETEKTPVYDDQGELVGIFGISTDITARQATEALLARHARCAEGLARCSQDLLRDRSYSTPTATALVAALRHLRHAVDAHCAAIYARPARSNGQALTLVAHVHAQGADSTCPEQLSLPERVQTALEARCAWGGAAAHGGAPQPATSPALLLLPLHVDGSWWGCLALYRAADEPAWHPQELQALEVAAEMIGAFVQSRNKTDALRRRIAELTALSRIVHAVTGEADLRTALLQVSELLSELFGGAGVTCWLYDERNVRLRREATAGDEPGLADMPATVALSASPLAQQALERETAFLGATVNDDPLLAGPSGPTLLMRLQVWETPLGLLTIRAVPSAKPFTAADIALAETIAGTLASALTNIRLLATEQHQRRLAESLRQVTLDLAGNLDLATLTGALFTQLQRVLPCESAAVLLHHDDALFVTAGMGTPAAHIGRQIALRSAYRVVLPFETRHPVAGLAGDPPWFPWALGDDPCRWMGVPLLRGQTPLGVLAVEYCAAEIPGDELIATLQTFAGHVAIAIDNAQRYQAAAELAAERERRHLARELHDSVSQSLYFANLAAESLPAIWELDPDEGRQRLDELQRFTRSAQAEMRTLLIELRPDLLVDLPLDEALWRLIAVLTAKTAETQLDVQIDPVPVLPPDVQIALYRIAQEALSNVVKHARAAHVGFQLAIAPAYVPRRPWHGTLTLVVVDDGRGFNPAQSPPGRLGLTSLAERAVGIGATLRILSSPGGGTQVRVEWKWERAEG